MAKAAAAEVVSAGKAAGKTRAAKTPLDAATRIKAKIKAKTKAKLAKAPRPSPFRRAPSKAA